MFCRRRRCARAKNGPRFGRRGDEKTKAPPATLPARVSHSRRRTKAWLAGRHISWDGDQPQLVVGLTVRVPRRKAAPLTKKKLTRCGPPHPPLPTRKTKNRPPSRTWPRTAPWRFASSRRRATRSWASPWPTSAARACSPRRLVRFCLRVLGVNFFPLFGDGPHARSRRGRPSRRYPSLTPFSRISAPQTKTHTKKIPLFQTMPCWRAASTSPSTP